MRKRTEKKDVQSENVQSENVQRVDNVQSDNVSNNVQSENTEDPDVLENEPRSQKEQRFVLSIIDADFIASTKVCNDSAIDSDSDVSDLTKKLETAKDSAVYADKAAQRSNVRLVTLMLRPFIQRHGGRWDNQKNEWDDKGKAIVQNITNVAINEKGEPLKGIVRGGQPINVQRVFLSSVSDVASWDMWLKDSYKALRKKADSALAKRSEKVNLFILNQHNFMMTNDFPSVLSLSAAIERAGKFFKIDVQSIRKHYFKEIQKARIVNKAHVNAKNKRAK